ncbi:hypothetical protein MARBORIA2_06290 [Methanobrevibacter arboriphilus]|jgi:hypothetical protein|uniref:Uncharacterized protein n=1 Tax=Methanobrevibacter arboriphilus TaxID=39441 RepID=A0ACA8R1B5_METAZ|nr:hypothetical protein [Methanobrevibacter arboriphilus]MCC7562779.1 hypothetical protein [Methanobrevibacter arboriphilus]BBL61023.1 hypothetical protein MarbSA_00630 [Methanobrevibacter arboriphilus]GLI11539.1 hypothetical protein MARBORIA2_06290 [Methanobrevibacter arboriphilus]
MKKDSDKESDKKSKTLYIEDLLPKKIHIKLSIGELKFEEPCVGDKPLLLDLIEKELKPKEFDINFLYNKIEENIDFKLFDSINEEELNHLIIEYIENVRWLDDYYENTGNIFEDFKNALIKHNKLDERNNNEKIKHVKTINVKLPTISDSTMKIIENATISYQRAMDNVSTHNNLFINPPTFKIPENISNIINQYQNVHNIVNNAILNIPDVIIPQIKILTNWVDSSKYLANLYTTLNKKFLKEYEIPLSKFSEDLMEYQWFITPSMTWSLIRGFKNIIDNSGNIRKDLNNLYYAYYSANNFDNIEDMVINWNSNNVLRPTRFKIIKNCVKLLKQDNEISIAYLIVPTLLAQIDGIEQEFLKKIGISRKEFIDNQDSDYESAKLIFLDVLYESVYPGGSITHPINFNRHKIIHGEFLNGYTKYNIIRCFLVLDFLINSYIESIGDYK